MLSDGMAVGWSIGAQAANSAGNLLLAVGIAHAGTANDFGIFGVAFALFLILQGLFRSYFGEPLLTLCGQVEEEKVARLLCVGCIAVRLLLLISALAALASYFLHGAFAAALVLAAGAGVFADWGRYRSFANSAVRSVFMFDLTWMAITLVGAMATWVLSSPGPETVVICWVLGALVPAPLLRTLSNDQKMPASGQRLDLLRRGTQYSIDFFLQSGVAPVLIVVLAYSHGTSFAGAARAAQMGLAPIAAAVLGVRPILLGRAPIDGAVRGFRGAAAAIAIAVFGWTAAFHLLPETFVNQVFGEASVGMGEFMVPMAMLLLAASFGTLCTALFRSAGRATVGISARAAALVMSLLIVFFLPIDALNAWTLSAFLQLLVNAVLLVRAFASTAEELSQKSLLRIEEFSSVPA